jgi:hypothetical protein
MALYDFTIILDRPLTDEDYDAIFEAGLDDSAPGINNGRGYIAVSRESDRLLTALTTALRDVASAGLTAVSILDEDMVTLTQIAERSGRTHESVRLLAAGKRGPGSFPAPISDGKPSLYSWAEVADWFADALGVAVQPHDSDARLLTAANYMLRARAIAPNEFEFLATA